MTKLDVLDFLRPNSRETGDSAGPGRAANAPPALRKARREGRLDFAPSSFAGAFENSLSLAMTVLLAPNRTNGRIVNFREFPAVFF